MCVFSIAFCLNFIFSGMFCLNDYICTDKKNACVVCDDESNYQRFNVVPKVYRAHLPEAFKSHRPHDGKCFTM